MNEYAKYNEDNYSMIATSPSVEGMNSNFNYYQVIEKATKKRWAFVEFDSISDMVETSEANSHYEFGGNGSWPFGYEKSKTSEWAFGKEFNNSAALTKRHLLEGTCPDAILNRVDAVRNSLYKDFPELQDLERHALKMRRKRRFAEDGDDLDIDRYMCGDPEQWAKMQRVPQKRSVRVQINGAMLGGHSAIKFAETMIMCAAMIDIIESAGISVEFIYSAISSSMDTHDCDVMSISALCKSANEPLDISRVLSCAASGIFRKYVFHIRNNVCGSYEGISLYEIPSFIKEMKDIDVCVSATDSRETVVSMFTDVIKNFNI